MSNTTHFNPEYEYLVNELKLKKTKDCLAEMSYQQLKDFYYHYNLQSLTYGPLDYTFKKVLKIIYKYKFFHSSESEKSTWFLNMKHTYELLSQIPNIESKNLIICFETLIVNGRIDTLIETSKGIFVIEYSHLKPDRTYETKKEIKQNQLNSYCKYLCRVTNKTIVGMIYFDNIDETINRTLETLKDFLN